MTRSHLEIGQTVNNWTITSPPIDDGGAYKYEVVCRCGALGVKTKSDMRKYQYCRECKRNQYDPGVRIGKRTIIKRQEPYHLVVECECGRIFKGRIDTLKRHHHCNHACRNFTDLINNKQTNSTEINVSKSHAFQIYYNAKKFGTLCDEWEYDFIAFLRWYIKVVGCSIDTLPTPSVVDNTITFRRITTERVWEPSNVEVRKFFTERANDRPTYVYWQKLQKRDLLEDDVSTYLNFIQAFGTKQRKHVLRRHDPTRRHARDNSYWDSGSNGDSP